MELLKSLEEAGLTGNESKIYLELAKKGELSANKIAKAIGMDRTLTYTVLNHLIEKGQVSYIIKQNKKVFSVANPENLLNNLRSKETKVIDLISELQKIQTEKPSETEIKIYEGTEGIRTFLRLALKEKELCAFGSTGRILSEIYEAEALAKQIEKSKLKLRIIGNEKYKGTKSFNFKFEYKYNKVESEATTSIFGDYVSIHMIKDKPIIILIKNKDIAQSYKNHFEYLWNLEK
jgi:sugar-specific transcriptional regulator TrmB